MILLLLWACLVLVGVTADPNGLLLFPLEKNGFVQAAYLSLGNNASKTSNAPLWTPIFRNDIVMYDSLVDKQFGIYYAVGYKRLEGALVLFASKYKEASIQRATDLVPALATCEFANLHFTAAYSCMVQAEHDKLLLFASVTGMSRDLTMTTITPSSCTYNTSHAGTNEQVGNFALCSNGVRVCAMQQQQQQRVHMLSNTHLLQLDLLSKSYKTFAHHLPLVNAIKLTMQMHPQRNDLFVSFGARNHTLYRADTTSMQLELVPALDRQVLQPDWCIYYNGSSDETWLIWQRDSDGALVASNPYAKPVLNIVWQSAYLVSAMLPLNRPFAIDELNEVGVPLRWSPLLVIGVVVGAGVLVTGSLALAIVAFMYYRNKKSKDNYDKMAI